MSAEMVRKIADAVLYEGYMLYPYRPSNVKNRQRWTFGGLYPEACAEANGDRTSLQAEVLVKAAASPQLKSRSGFCICWRKPRRADVATGRGARSDPAESGGGTCRERFRFPASEHVEGD